jgi:hypothetical protein
MYLGYKQVLEMEKIKFIIPTSWLPALINSDFSGYEQSEIEIISTFQQHMIDKYGSATALSSGEPYISSRNDIEEFIGDQEIGEVAEVTFPVTYKGDLSRVINDIINDIKAIKALKEITPDDHELGQIIKSIDEKIYGIKSTQLPDCDGSKVTEIVKQLKRNKTDQDSLGILSQLSQDDQKKFIQWFDKIVNPNKIMNPNKNVKAQNIFNPSF